MSYAVDFTLSTTTTFIGQVQMSMINSALQIASEPSSPHSRVDAKRNSLAVGVLNNASAYLTRFVLAVIEANGVSTLNASSTDAQVDTAVATVWNGIAGVTQIDKAVP